jgi:hypothetical protein
VKASITSIKTDKTQKTQKTDKTQKSKTTNLTNEKIGQLSPKDQSQLTTKRSSEGTLRKDSEEINTISELKPSIAHHTMRTEPDTHDISFDKLPSEKDKKLIPMIDVNDSEPEKQVTVKKNSQEIERDPYEPILSNVPQIKESKIKTEPNEPENF